MADIVFPGQSAGAANGALPQNTDLVIYKGDYLEVFVQIRDSSGNPVPAAGLTAKAQLKVDYYDMSPREFQLTATATPGEWRIFLPSSVTSTLLPGNYIWDFQLTDASSNTRTYLAGDVTVINDVTN